jgi:hypothetical protein
MGTEEAILKVTSNIHNDIDNNFKPLAIFLDLAKAFDTVPHALLFTKLYQNGIRGIPLELLKSYLSNRIQYVSIGGTLSSPREIEFGVPQGTVLGPLLFLIYINDLCSLQIDGKITTFADDTVIQFSAKSWTETYSKAESEMRKVSLWLNSNLLALNKEKTVYCTFSPRINSQPSETTLKLHDIHCKTINAPCICHKLEKVTHTKYLGITIDQHLKWDSHIQTIIKKLRFVIHKFYDLRNILNSNILLSVYYALAQSIMQYGITGWGGTYDCHIAPLETIQHTILKIIFNKPQQYPTEYLYDKINILSIRKLYTKFATKFVHRNKALLHVLNPQSKNQITTRSKTAHLLEVQRVKKNITQRHIMFLGPKLYNAIPQNIRDQKSSKTFSFYQKQWLLSYPNEQLDKIINIKTQ